MYLLSAVLRTRRPLGQVQRGRGEVCTCARDTSDLPRDRCHSAFIWNARGCWADLVWSISAGATRLRTAPEGLRLFPDPEFLKSNAVPQGDGPRFNVNKLLTATVTGNVATATNTGQLRYDTSGRKGGFGVCIELQDGLGSGVMVLFEWQGARTHTHKKNNQLKSQIQ